MNHISLMQRGLFVLTAFLLTCISLSTDWLFEGGSLTDGFSDCIALLEAQRKSEQLWDETHAAMERFRVKEWIAVALSNGEMRLIDAAAYFCSLHEDPKSWHHPQKPRPEQHDAEGWCREVIEWTEGYISCQQSPSQAETLRQRLETELQKQLGRHDTVTLPD